MDTDMSNKAFVLLQCMGLGSLPRNIKLLTTGLAPTIMVIVLPSRDWSC